MSNNATAQTFYSLCLAGTHSGAGKTTVTLGLLSALNRRGFNVQPFKCGPDYIDSGHHRRAAGTTSRNLDTWMMTPEGVDRSYAHACSGSDIAVVEGVMGLYDGAAPDSSEGSTAHVARRLGIPVVLIVDAKAMARSVAALVQGYATFEKDVHIAGVIANNVSSGRHGEILTQALEAYDLPPLLGWLPRRDELTLPERHLGLIADTESGLSASWYDTLAQTVEQYTDVDQLLKRCKTSRPTPQPLTPPAVRTHQHAPSATTSVRLGIARDDAFHFYYQDNLDMLEEGGVDLVPFSPLRDKTLPDNLHGLYLGGGFPEMFGQALAQNTSLRADIADFAARGHVVFAECGGLMYLCRTMIDAEEREHDMCGVIPAMTQMEPRRRRLGYVIAETAADGIFGPAGTALRGHEFHWSSLADVQEEISPAFTIRHPSDPRTEPKSVGFRLNNVWASYIHLHFASNPDALQTLVNALKTNTHADTY